MTDPVYFRAAHEAMTRAQARAAVVLYFPENEMAAPIVISVAGKDASELLIGRVASVRDRLTEEAAVG